MGHDCAWKSSLECMWSLLIEPSSLDTFECRFKWVIRIFSNDIKTFFYYMQMLSEEHVVCGGFVSCTIFRHLGLNVKWFFIKCIFFSALSLLGFHSFLKGQRYSCISARWFVLKNKKINQCVPWGFKDFFQKSIIMLGSVCFINTLRWK